MKLFLKKASLLFSLVFVFYACETPKVYLIPQDKMVEVLVDIHIADGVLSTESFDYDIEKLRPENYYKNVLEKHHLDRAIFDSALSQYSADRLVYVEMYEQVIDVLRTKESYLQAISGNEKNKFKELNLFYYTFSTQYETTDGLSENIQKSLTTDVFNSGKQAYHVQKEPMVQKYSSLLTEPIEELEFEVKAWVKFDEVMEHYPELEFVLEKGGEILTKNTVSLDKFIDNKMTWKEINVKVKLSIKSPESKVKVSCYFLNKNKSSFYLDDYFVRIKQIK